MKEFKGFLTVGWMMNWFPTNVLFFFLQEKEFSLISWTILGQALIIVSFIPRTYNATSAEPNDSHTFLLRHFVVWTVELWNGNLRAYVFNLNHLMCTYALYLISDEKIEGNPNTWPWTYWRGSRKKVIHLYLQ